MSNKVRVLKVTTPDGKVMYNIATPDPLAGTWYGNGNFASFDYDEAVVIAKFMSEGYDYSSEVMFEYPEPSVEV